MQEKQSNSKTTQKEKGLSPEDVKLFNEFIETINIKNIKKCII